MAMPWFRMYWEMLDDPKIGTLDDATFRTWVEILCLACEAGNSGNTDLTVTETSWKLRRDVTVTVEKLLHVGVVTLQKRFNGDETIFVTQWKKRQYQSDSSTLRVKIHREKRSSNGDETFQ